MSIPTSSQINNITSSSIQEVREGQNTNINNVAVFNKELEKFQNTYQMHSKTIHKNRKVSISEYRMEGKTGVKAFFQKTKNLCHNIALIFRPGNEKKANDAARRIARLVTELKKTIDALNPDVLLEEKTLKETMRNLADTGKQIQGYIKLVKSYNGTSDFNVQLKQSLTNIENLNKTLNSLYSALRIMEKRQNGEPVTIGEIKNEFQSFTEAVHDRTNGMAKKLDDLYGNLYKKYSPDYKNIYEKRNKEISPSAEELNTAFQNLSVNGNLMPQEIYEFFEDFDYTEGFDFVKIEPSQREKEMIKKMTPSEKEIEAAAAEMAEKNVQECYKNK